jgi:myo-inositol 2-dehydrogenase/D-chiro-inositol 1-dehydrogenase
MTEDGKHSGEEGKVATVAINSLGDQEPHDGLGDRQPHGLHAEYLRTRLLARSDRKGFALVRLGVIGTGRIGTSHAAVLAGLPDVESVTITDLDIARAELLAQRDGYRLARRVDVLIDEVDAVIITAATPAHAQLISQSVRSGKPTFCEKPIALDLESTRQVVAEVKAAGVAVQIGFQRRFDPGYMQAKQLVATGELGTLYIVRMAGHDPEPPHEDYISVSGGLFRDFSVHDFDALRFVTGQEVVEVYSDGSVIGFPVFDKYGDVDTGVVALRLEEGALGILSAARHDPLGYDIRMELFGSSDSVVVGWDGRTPMRSLEPDVPPPPGPAYRGFQDRFRRAYELELAAFLELARGERENPCTPTDALEALAIAVACDVSRLEHRPVRVEEVK